MHDESLDPVLQQQVEQTAERLHDEFAALFSDETIAHCVSESLELLSGSRINTYVAVLTYRFARERLKALAQVEGAIPKDVPEILFVCVHNAGRSQMAAGLTNLHACGRVHVRSAGSTPASEINAAAIAALREIGVDMTEEFPKPLTDEVVRAADVVITMGCGDACPIYPGKTYQDWDIDDPADQDIDTVRRIRNDLDQRVRNLLSELAVESAR